jgi:N-acetylneuraminate synthase
LAAEAGADAAKFQHFNANTIVSDTAFKNLNGQIAHQAAWKKSVYEVYADASVSLDWNEELKITCEKAGIHFFTTPYDLEIVDAVDPLVPAFKIGSGDITWGAMLQKVAEKGKTYILATGASTQDDVDAAVAKCLSINKSLILMQCNTNYTASLENFKYINLNVLKSYSDKYPYIVLGLSDHTPGHTTVLGAVTLGAAAIEKHFTDDVSRIGPDHKFSMDPTSWREMVDRTRELEYSLGNGVKVIEENETESSVVQRRSITASKDLEVGTILASEHFVMLRPCPVGAVNPSDLKAITGKTLKKPMQKGEPFFYEFLA